MGGGGELEGERQRAAVATGAVAGHALEEVLFCCSVGRVLTGSEGREVRGPDEPFAATVASALTRSRRSFLFIMERIKIKDRVKAWRGWREYMGLLREQNAMVAIFMHKKRILDTRNIILAWKDQVRCATMPPPRSPSRLTVC